MSLSNQECFEILKGSIILTTETLWCITKHFADISENLCADKANKFIRVCCEAVLKDKDEKDTFWSGERSGFFYCSFEARVSLKNTYHPSVQLLIPAKLQILLQQQLLLLFLRESALTRTMQCLSVRTGWEKGREKLLIECM